MAFTTELDAVAIGGAATAAFVLEPPRHSPWDARPLAAGKYLIGSAGDCQIRLPIDGVQPHHALLIVGERKSLLKAWDERTWINDWPVKESVLRTGDRISIGPVTMRWRAARAEEIPAVHFPAAMLQGASQRQIEDDSLSVQPPMESSAAPEVELPAPQIVPRPVAPVPAVEIERLSRQERRLEELAQVLDERAESLQREFDRQTDEFRNRESDWIREQHRIAEELGAQERELQARRVDIEAWNQRLDVRESELESREAAWAANIAEIQAAREATQREADREIAERLNALQAGNSQLQAEIEANRRFREDLTRLEQSLADRELALSEAEKDFAERQSSVQSDRASLEARLAEYERAGCDLDEQRAQLTELRQLLTAEQAALAEDRAALDEHRREISVRLAETNERQCHLGELQTRLDEERESLVAARREIQAGRAALEEERAAIIADRSAFAAERESLAALHAGSNEETSQEGAVELETERARLEGERASFLEQRRLFEDEQTAYLSQLESFEARQREWQEAAEQHRLSAEARDRDLADRQQELAESSARLLEDRRELELRCADLDGAQQKLQSALSAREAEHGEVQRRQSQLDQVSERLRRDHEQLLASREELEAAREEWQREADGLRQALETRSQALNDAELQLANREAEWSEHLRVEQEALAAEKLQLDAERKAWSLETERSRQELDSETEALRELEAQLATREAALSERADAGPAETLQAMNQAAQVEIERLTEELDREQEFRRTVETQLEGIRSRHERDAELWNSERTDWMVERDRLERELEAAVRQAESRRTKPVERSTSEPAPIENLDGDRYRAASDADDRPRWNDNEIASVGAERNHDPVETAEDADPLNHVRAELAKMFELSEQPASTAVASIVDVEESAAAEPPRVSIAPPEPAASQTDWQSRLEALRRQAELEPPASPAPAARIEPVSAPSPAAEEEDSIAAYMERMLARNRKGDEPGTPSVPRSEPLADRQPVPTPFNSSAAPSLTDVVVPQKERRSKPRPASDKGAVREHLDVFREVANASARKAVAKHTSRRLWMLIVAKGIVALVCAVASAAFLYVSTVGRQAYHWQALGCGVLGLVVGLDLLRHVFRPRRAVARSKSAGRNAIPGSDDDESSLAGDDEPADEVVRDA